MVRVERRHGPTVERLTPFAWHDVAEAELRRLAEIHEGTMMLGLATCRECKSSDDGCQVCNPDHEPRP